MTSEGLVVSIDYTDKGRIKINQNQDDEGFFFFFSCEEPNRFPCGHNYSSVRKFRS